MPQQLTTQRHNAMFPGEAQHHLVTLHRVDTKKTIELAAKLNANSYNQGQVDLKNTMRPTGTHAVIDIQDFAALAHQAGYNSAGLAQKKKALALIENKFTCTGQA